MHIKKLILFIASAFLLASCSDTIKESVHRKVIDFRVVTTRGIETRIENFEKFESTALLPDGNNFYNGIEFIRTGVYYNSYEAYYWPSFTTMLRFYAWSPTAEELPGTIAINGDNQLLKDFTPSTDISSQIDFISAATSGSEETSAAGVELNFQHNLAQLEVKATCRHEGYVLKVSGISFNNFIGQATFDFESSEWELSENKITYLVEYDTARTLGDTAINLMKEDGNNALIIPQTLIQWNPGDDRTNTEKGAFIGIKIQISTKAGTRIFPLYGNYDWMAIPINGKLEAGYRYIYTIDFTAGSGFVSPDKTPPTEGSHDCFGPGDEIYGQQILISPDVSAWSIPTDI